MTSLINYVKQSTIYNYLTNVHVCGGGGFGYAGYELKGKIAHAEALALLQYDSETGGAHGGLVGGGLGPFTAGFATMRNWRNWSVTNSLIALGGGSIPKLNPSNHMGKLEIGGLAERVPNGLAVGGYAGSGSFGGGGYATLSSGPCTP